MICAALVTAAGVGKRMGGGGPKQYLDLEGMPIAVRSLLAFSRHPKIDSIVLTVRPGDEDLCRSSLLEPFDLAKVVQIVAGGASRQASVFNGLKRVEHTDITAIHDAARPLVSAETIDATLLGAESAGAAMAGVRVRETVKRKIGDQLETVPRDDLWLARTPQTFRTDLIIEAHRAAVRDGFVGTDDASLVERLGRPVMVVEDSDRNIKITTPEDLGLARLLLTGPGRGWD